MNEIASTIRFATKRCNGVDIHHALMGDPENPPLLCLHGFPEFWMAWEGVMPLLAQAFFLVVPDQRGFNLSTKPSALEAYHTSHLVKDMVALTDHYGVDRQWVLAGHDWGAAVAYALAMNVPQRWSHLIVLNGVHPACFQRAILEDAAQRQASQYMSLLRADGAEEMMRQDGYAKTLSMMEKFSSTPWLDDKMKALYRKAYGQEGALSAMLNWYRVSPIIVPPVGAAVATAPLLEMAQDQLRVTQPHLVIWGEEDQALRPSTLAGLDRYADDLTIHKIAGTGHWLLHERPQEIAGLMARFAR